MKGLFLEKMAAAGIGPAAEKIKAAEAAKAAKAAKAEAALARRKAANAAKRAAEAARGEEQRLLAAAQGTPAGSPEWQAFGLFRRLQYSR